MVQYGEYHIGKHLLLTSVLTKNGRKKLRSFFDLSNAKHNKRFYQYVCCLSCGMQEQTGKNIDRLLGFGGKVTAFL